MDIMPLQGPTNVMDFYTNIEEATLFDCLKFLLEMDGFYDTAHSLLNFPSTDDNPLSCVWLKDTQDEDPKLCGLCNDPSSGFHKKNFAGQEFVCFTEKDKDNDWKICLSDSAVHHAIRYFCLLLNHPGKQRLLQGMNRYVHPDLRKKY